MFILDILILHKIFGYKPDEGALFSHPVVPNYISQALEGFTAKKIVTPYRPWVGLTPKGKRLYKDVLAGTQYINPNIIFPAAIYWGGDELLDDPFRKEYGKRWANERIALLIEEFNSSRTTGEAIPLMELAGTVQWGANIRDYIERFDISLVLEVIDGANYYYPYEWLYIAFADSGREDIENALVHRKLQVTK